LAGTSRFDAFRRTSGRLDKVVVGNVAAAERSQRSTLNAMVVIVALAGGAALVLGVVVALVLVRAIGTTARRLERVAAERDRRARELARSNEQLQEFAYVASHDLSEPLRAVSGFAQLLGRRYSGKLDAEADEFIGFIVDGAERMQRLIRDLLEYSRAGRGEMHLAPVDCTQVVDRVVATFEGRIATVGAAVNVADPLPVVAGDEGQLERVFQNLIANALKFTPPGEAPVVRVDAQRKNGAWEFSISDQGIGVPIEHQERVFRMFQRLNAREEYEGTGVGLAVTKTIVERHGGRIWLAPVEPHGSSFHFTVPDRREAT
jgi:light-regulated signal transduction histidine kinase (bacteriophytochrome)